MATRVDFEMRNDTAANLAAANRVYRAGEPIFETDTQRHKIGDGATAYNDLPYYTPIDYGPTLPDPTGLPDGRIFFLTS